MRAGIAEAIPTALGSNKRGWRRIIDEEYFSEEFFEDVTVDDHSFNISERVKKTMGTGIAAAIPIVLKPNIHDFSREVEREYFSENFFENYTVDETGSIYTIKPELLISNYQSFITEFYDCIGEKYDAENTPIPCVAHYADFEITFDSNERYSLPHLQYDSMMFHFLGGKSTKYWLFYHGSFKAILETYCTLLHFERILPKAMKNPLANTVKFGMYG